MASINKPFKPTLPPRGGMFSIVTYPLSGTRFVSVVSTNRPNYPRTHGGAEAADIPIELQLRRAVCSCMLFENEHYENGQTISDRIIQLVAQTPVETVCTLAYDARTHFNLRHVPLLLIAAVAAPGRGGSRVIGDALADVIQRPDELSEFVAIYAKVYGVKPNAVKKRLSAQVKKGLAAAFRKFNQYQLSRYFSQSGEKDAAVRGRDVMFLTHPRPINPEQELLFKRLAAKEAIQTGGAGSWETELSSGKDKRETFERLIREGKLGYLALIRNLRGMTAAGVDCDLISQAILARRNGAERVLPWRFITAAQAEPSFEDVLSEAMVANMSSQVKLPGKTLIIVDVSGSMYAARLSARSEMTRLDAACALAAIACEACADSVIYVTAGNDRTRVHATARVDQDLHGIAMARAIAETFALLGGGGIFLKQMLDFVHAQEHSAERIIVITDEQDCDIRRWPALANPFGRYNYMINVASAANGVGYGDAWIHLDGFSEQALAWIPEFEKLYDGIETKAA